MDRLEFVITEGHVQTDLERFGEILDQKSIWKAAQLFAIYGYSGYKVKVIDGREHNYLDRFIITIYKDKKAVSSIFIYKKDYNEFEDILAEAYNGLDVNLEEAYERLQHE